MKDQDIAYLRLLHQNISSFEFNSPVDLVDHMGAVQAQNYSMMLWALGLRVPGSTKADIEILLDEGKLIRTHILRPTWHVIHEKNFHWMMDLSGPRLKKLSRPRLKELKLIDTMTHILDQLQMILSEGHLQRNQIKKSLQEAGINTNDNRLSHILMQGELDKLICNGCSHNGKLTYALISERISSQDSISRIQALHRLARRYFYSHGPATVRDFSWWSGLTLTECRVGLESVRKQLICKKVNNNEYWMKDDLQDKVANLRKARLLPAFDEFVIGYADRSAILSEEYQSDVISKNGIFWPVIVVNGAVIGIWKKSIRNNTITVGLQSFYPHSKKALREIRQQVKRYGKFLNKNILF